VFETFRNAWKIEDLRKRLMYTLLILVLFRVGCAITVPYINPAVLMGSNRIGWIFLKFSCIIRIVWEVLL